MFKLKKQYRLFGYDYSQNGCYFITIVTKNRQHHFGKIVNNIMQLSAIGKFANDNVAKFFLDENAVNPFATNPYFVNQSGYMITH